MLCQCLKYLVLFPVAVWLSAATVATFAEGRQCRRAVHIAFKVLMLTFFISAAALALTLGFLRCPAPSDCPFQTIRNSAGLCASPPARPLFQK